MRLGQNGENYENAKAKVVSDTGGQKEMHVPMEVDCVSGSEQGKEDWEDVDEVRMGSTCYNCWVMVHIASDCRRKGKGKAKD